MTDASPVLTGGCQCGAIRYALYAEPASADICHCRMCQKAMGNLFMAVASVPREQFAWTAGTPATFQSSAIAERGFCEKCGTPLSFRYLSGERISVTTGSLDEPARARPTSQIGIAGSGASCGGSRGPERGPGEPPARLLALAELIDHRGRRPDRYLSDL